MDNLPRVLIVDDEPQIRKLLKLTLASEGFKISEAVNGREGASFTVTNRPDLVLLDLGLPDMNGLEVLKEIRQWSEVPVIILTVQDETETIVAALNAGADDFVPKPFEAKELLARIRVCLRRSIKKDYEQEIVEVRNIRVDFSSRVVLKDGVEVKLTSTEYELLKYLIKNANKILTNRQILRDVWGPSSVENTQYPRVYVRHLRQKLEDNPDAPKLIQTESGVGYRLKTKD